MIVYFVENTPAIVDLLKAFRGALFAAALLVNSIRGLMTAWRLLKGGRQDRCSEIKHA
jgi:hypothetical protein